jgi:hypothetical protein
VETSKGQPDEKALGSLATLFNEVLADPEARKQFFAEPRKGLGSLDLPAEVADFFEDLSYEELRLLARTCETMTRARLSYELPGGGRVCFL